MGQIIAILDALAKASVAFVALKENIRVGVLGRSVFSRHPLSSKTTCRLSAAPAQGGLLPAHAVA